MAAPRLRAASLLFSACLAVGACGEVGDGGMPAVEAAPGGEDGANRAPPGTPAYQVVASGLEVPWDLAFAPDGRVFVTERPGRIRVIEQGELRPEPWATLDVAATGEAGLTALALDPAFAENGYLYVLATFRTDGGLVNRIVRLTDTNGGGGEAVVLVDGLPADEIHAGSALDVGPDGLLWVTTGDAGQPERAADPAALHGKLLRYRTDGTPAGEGPAYARGLRNSQGLAWHPSGAVFASEHGPSGLPWEGGRTGHDELNQIVEGGHYGWPEVAGRGGGERFVQPLAVWRRAIAPSGIAIYTGDDFPAWRGHAFLGALRGRQLRRVALEQAGGGWRAGEQEALFGELGRIRAVVMGPDGALWFTTSNRDGRGSPAAADDRVLRLVVQ